MDNEIGNLQVVYQFTALFFPLTRNYCNEMRTSDGLATSNFYPLCWMQMNLFDIYVVWIQLN